MIRQKAARKERLYAASNTRNCCVDLQLESVKSVHSTYNYMCLLATPTRRKIMTFISNEARRRRERTLFLHLCIVFIYRAMWPITYENQHLTFSRIMDLGSLEILPNRKAFLRFVLMLLINICARRIVCPRSRRYPGGCFVM